jgi:predicted nucleotidyltransferase
MLTADQHDALASLRAHFLDARIVIIGATALRLQRRLPRNTADVDLVIAVSASEFPGSLEGDPKWTRSERAHSPQRWSYRGHLPFDLLPIGEQELARKELVWPDGTVMGVDGFELLFDSALPMLAGSERVHVAPIPVVALLKMVAWLDRPADRQRDLDDLNELMKCYLDESVDDDFDRLVELGIGSIGHARALGEDVAKLARLDVCARFLALLEQRYLFMWPGRRDDEDADALLTAFKQGLRQ